jgi:predicted glycosyltransferase
MRAVLFCNEMLGLGHLRLSLALAAALVASDDSSTALVVTGSPASGGVRLPQGVDVLKLPTAPVGPDSAWSATGRRPTAGLAVAVEVVRALRAELSLATVRELRPDVVVVDYLALGRGGDLVPALEHLRGRGDCTVALGLWEVDDAPERLAERWTHELQRAVASLYDLALVYGPAVAGDLRLARLHDAGVPVHHTRRVGARAAHSGPTDLPDEYLLVTAGGGADGFALLDSVLGALRAEPLDRPAVLVTGPLMAATDVARLRATAAGLDARVHEFRTDMDAVLAGACAVVAMAGYSTVAEVLATGLPLLLVPRVFPREEQLNRARRLADAGRARLLMPDQLDPASLRAALGELLAQPRVAAEPPLGAQDAAALLRGFAG